MNYFEHHIGDYDQATAHLTACEDGVYSRLIRWYMASERPLPADIKVIQRRVRALSKDERQAVETILGEFFELGEDGYRQQRCDEELARYHETIPEREERRENDRERQRRARDRRKQLFSTLRDAGIVPPFDAKSSELESLLSRASSHDLSRGQSQGVTRDNTATQTPDTRHQYSSDVEHPQSKAPVGTSARTVTLKAKDLVSEGIDPQVADDWMAVRKAKKAPLTQSSWEAVKREAAAAGLTPAQAVKIAAESNWQGFKASWLQRDGLNGSGARIDIFAGAK